MHTQATLIIFSLVAFGLVHSFTASHSFKQQVRGVIGHRMYDGFFRVTYNLVSVATIAPTLYFLSMPSPVLWSTGSKMTIVFYFLQAIGVTGIVTSLWQIDWLTFAGIRQIGFYFKSRVHQHPGETLVVTGLYTFTRHPLYFFSLMYLWFVPVMTISKLCFTLATTLYFIVGSYFEEKKMVKQFGNHYEQYQKAVPWLIPFLKITKPRTL